MQALRKVLVLGLLVIVATFGFASGQGEEAGEADDSQELQPITRMTNAELLASYDDLPFTDVLPLEEGPIEIDGEVRDIVIGFSQTGFNHPWRIAMLQSLQAEAARHSNVSVIALDGNVDIAKQNDDIRDLLARGVDAVIMSPVESAGLVPAAREVMRRGLPLVVLDRDVPTEKTLFIGQSNVTMAERVAEVMVEELDGEGNIVVITGLLGSSPAVDRDKGMENVISNYPGINVLVKGDGEWIREPSVQLMEDWLTAYEDIDAVFSHAEESSWGAQLAIARAGRCDEDIKHYTFDGSNAGFKSVKEGTFQADGNYTPFIADIGLRAVLYEMMGREIPDKQEYEFPGYLLRLPDSPTVVPENADEWIGRGWGDFDPPVDPCK